MALLILSFIAGVLTVAAPCVLPLLPVIIGGSVVEAGRDRPERQWFRPLVIAASLAVSVVIFTLLIKATTALLGVPQVVWQVISGTIVILLGVYYLYPYAWARLSAGSFIRSNKLLTEASGHKGVGGSVLIGASLGPVFSSCSPTYALIVAAVLPVSFATGLAYLISYAIGMSVTLLLIAYLGQAFVARLRWLGKPRFKHVIGVFFIAVGLMVMTGLDKRLQAYVIDHGWYAPISNLEERLAD